MSKLIIEHTEDCGAVGAEDCYCTEGEWLQPPGCYATEAVDECGEDTPWCQIHALAFDLMDHYEG